MRATELGKRGWFRNGDGDYHALAGLPVTAPAPAPVPAPEPVVPVKDPVPESPDKVPRGAASDVVAHKPAQGAVAATEKKAEVLATTTSPILSDVPSPSKLPGKAPGARPLAALRAKVPRMDFTSGLVAGVLLLLLVCNLAACVRRAVHSTTSAGNYGEVDKHGHYGEEAVPPGQFSRAGQESLPASKDQFLRTGAGWSSRSLEATPAYVIEDGDEN